MTAMDITPRELRDAEIKEAFRGYSRDDVDELLERAAAAIEGLSARVRQITDRISDAETSASRNRESEETLQRTLVLAQRTADAAVSDAQERARKMLEDAETKARTLVTEADSSARRIAEGERRRFESDLQDLDARRSSLTTDVEALERFETEYRQRIREAIEAELDTLGRISSSFVVPARPAVHEVDVPPPREGILLRDPDGQAASPDEMSSPEVEAQPSDYVSSLVAEPAEPAEAPPPAAAGFERLEPPSAPADLDTAMIDMGSPGGGAAEPFADLAPVESEEEPDPSSRPEAPSANRLRDFVSDDAVEPEVLDDDEFFASLREAVRDDAPLGPREQSSPAPTPFPGDDEDDAAHESRGRFRRRR